MTTKIEEIRKELEDNYIDLNKHGESCCPECDNCLSCNFTDSAQNKLEGFDFGIEMARKELFHERQKLQERINIAFNQGKEEARKEFLEKIEQWWNKQGTYGRYMDYKEWLELKQSLNSPLSTGDDGDVSKASISDVQSPICKPETLGGNLQGKGEKGR